MNEARNGAPMRRDWPMGLDRATADARYLRKNSVQVNATDYLALGASPPASGAIRVDAASYGGANGTVFNVTNGGSASVTLVVNSGGVASLVGGAGTALRLGGSGANAWQIDASGSVSTLFAQQATARIIGGTNGLQIRNSSNTQDNFSVSDTGTVVIAVSSAALTWNGRSSIASASDGNLVLRNAAATDFGLLQFGGTTSSFPALKRNGSSLQFRNAADTGWVAAQANEFQANGPANTVSAGVISYGGTTATTVGAAGGAAALPATPLGYAIWNVGGTQVKVPYYNN